MAKLTPERQLEILEELDFSEIVAEILALRSENDFLRNYFNDNRKIFTDIEKACDESWERNR